MFLFLVVFSEKDPGIEIAQGNIIFVLTFRINEASSFLPFRFFKLRKFLCIIEVLITVASFRIDETENKKSQSGLIGTKHACLSDKTLRALRLRLPVTGSTP